ANDGAALALEEAVGGVDTIYVVVPAPGDRLQVVRGGVYSYYEFTQDINARMTDDEWRALVESGNEPPRPQWVWTFFAE
ncbi:MAG: DUF3160 domain-containing protein, partial [Anaerolineae bacterium]|nr:DUF3160 domain-containing protein [Anaerolineae bacterium]